MKKETTYNKLIGRIGEDYYFLNEIFEYEGGLKGATGTVINALSEEEATERNESATDEDELLEFWKQAVEAGKTTESLSDWCELVRDEQGEDAGLDYSGREYALRALQIVLGEEACYTTNCIGGGRCFDLDMKWDKLYNRELWEEIKKFETKTN